MGKQFKALRDSDIEFIKKQKLFFIASSSNAEVNLSPKGYDCFRILNKNEVLYLDYPGSGNRLARDITNSGKVTIMFTAFEGSPMICRLFAKEFDLIEKDNEQFDEYFKLFDNTRKESFRRIVKFKIYAVENSCGMSVPLFEYKEEREGLRDYFEKRTPEKVSEYIKNKEVPIDLDSL